MLGFSQELIWFGVVFYDLLLAIFLFRYYGKYGLYCAVILGIILANLQGGKITELTMFGYTFNASMGAVSYTHLTLPTILLV